MHLITNPDPQLELVVLLRLPEVKDDLAKFLAQLVVFGTPPPGFEEVISEQWAYQNLLDQVNEAQEEQAALKVTLAQLHMIPDCVQEVILRDRLDLVESQLVQHVIRLSNPPNGCEKSIVPFFFLPMYHFNDHVLDLQHTIEALILSPASTKDFLNVPNPTQAADLHAMSPHLRSDNRPTHIAAHDVVVSATFDQGPYLKVSNAVSIMATPGSNMTTRSLASGIPKGSVSSRGSLEDCSKKGLRFFKNKFTFRSRREGPH
ncbi:hypothetical protein BJ165DRAFT_660639 [Panaeolus papilionaceus]|nr:hypothetical protein BJ165DRAFT_660639 [Panaeolus papilionaceus]